MTVSIGICSYSSPFEEQIGRESGKIMRKVRSMNKLKQKKEANARELHRRIDARNAFMARVESSAQLAPQPGISGTQQPMSDSHTPQT